MRDNLKMGSIVEKEYKDLKIEIHMRVNLIKIIEMDLGYLNGLMVIFMKEHLKMIKDMVRVFISTIMEIDIRVSGNMVTIMAKEN